MARFTDNVTQLNAATLNGLENELKNGFSLGNSDGKIILKNSDGTQIGQTVLPPASSSALGGVKAWVSNNGTLNIYTY